MKEIKFSFGLRKVRKRKRKYACCSSKFDENGGDLSLVTIENMIGKSNVVQSFEFR